MQKKKKTISKYDTYANNLIPMVESFVNDQSFNYKKIKLPIELIEKMNYDFEKFCSNSLMNGFEFSGYYGFSTTQKFFDRTLKVHISCKKSYKGLIYYAFCYYKYPILSCETSSTDYNLIVDTISRYCPFTNYYDGSGYSENYISLDFDLKLSPKQYSNFLNQNDERINGFLK